MDSSEMRKRFLARHPEPPPVGERVPVSEEVQAERFARVQALRDKHMQREGETDAAWQQRRQQQADEFRRKLDEEDERIN